ncbi:(deoxy)nucleoside triphosphate pyrophosphohydrolase [Nakamurella silvestris]|nr:(deoxy)nucleoside triphosphate pyrophosphohydrolase [Nakamurella silvestris]
MVAAAIVRDGRVLAARRTHPRREAGKWELPGGKVEPGETPQDALVREIAEELGVDIRVIRRIGPAVPLAVELVLHTYLAELISGDPEPAEHDRIAWLAAAELDGVHWLPADVELLPDLAELLAPEGSDRPQV